LIARGVATKGQLYQEDYLKKKQQEQKNKKELKAGRFSSGITEQHINKQPDDRLQIAAMPG
jgi:transposase